MFIGSARPKSRKMCKDELNSIFTQLIWLLAERGLITLDLEDIIGAKRRDNSGVGETIEFTPEVLSFLIDQLR